MAFSVCCLFSCIVFVAFLFFNLFIFGAPGPEKTNEKHKQLKKREKQEHPEQILEPPPEVLETSAKILIAPSCPLTAVYPLRGVRFGYRPKLNPNLSDLRAETTGSADAPLAWSTARRPRSQRPSGPTHPLARMMASRQS